MLCYGDCSVGKAFLLLTFLDSGFRSEILRGAAHWHCWEKGSRKLGVGEGVAWIISLGSFLKSILPPTPHSWSDHIKDIGGARASDPLCGGEVGGLWVPGICFSCILKPVARQQVLCVPEGESLMLRLWRLPTSREALVWAILIRDNKSSLINSRPPPSPRDGNFAQKCFWRWEEFQRAVLRKLFWSGIYLVL